MDTFLTTWITPEAIAASFKFVTPVFTELLDWMIPKSKRSKHLLPVITMEDLNDVFVNGLHSERGVIGWAVDGGTIEQTDFEPKPIKLTTKITAKDMINMTVIKGQKAKAEYTARWTGNLKNITELTMQAMASSFLLGTGTVTIQKNTNSGVIDETFVLGSIPTVTNTVDWDNAAALVSDAVETFREIAKKLKENGYGGKFEMLAGADAWNALVKLVEGYDSTASGNIGGVVSMEPGVINIWGYKVISIDYSKTLYSAKGATSTTDMIDPDLIYGMALNNKNVIKFCTLDRLDGKHNQPLVITSKVIDDEELVIKSDSKPFLLIDVDSFVTSDVMA